MNPKLTIKIEVLIDDEMWVREETSSWEIAEMKLDSFKRQFEKQQERQEAQAEREAEEEN